jgi:hypothetical protein
VEGGFVFKYGYEHLAAYHRVYGYAGVFLFVQDYFFFHYNEGAGACGGHDAYSL